jgi:hypothetical protein
MAIRCRIPDRNKDVKFDYFRYFQVIRKNEVRNEI